MTWTDRGTLRSTDYPDGRRLASRQSIYQWQEPRVDLAAHVMDALAALSGGSVVGDLGCGNGALLARVRAARPELRYLALDLSEGMLRELDGLRVSGSIDALPLRDATLDAALAMHVLYHLPDPAVGIAELRRVIRPGGVVVASTNSAASLTELWDLLVSAGGERSPVHDHWPLETAADAMRGSFDHVHVNAIDYVVDVPAAEPVVDYLASTGASAAILARARDRVASAIQRDGCFHASGRTGVIVGAGAAQLSAR